MPKNKIQIGEGPVYYPSPLNGSMSGDIKSIELNISVLTNSISVRFVIRCQQSLSDSMDNSSDNITMYKFLPDFIPIQSVPLTTNVVSLNSAQARCTRYNIM